MDFQKIWSDRLPRSTARDYVSIMKKLNSKIHFNANVYKYLDPVMEQIMKKPNNREWLVHAGQKGDLLRLFLQLQCMRQIKNEIRQKSHFLQTI